MSVGYVYVMTNPSMPGQVKIGMTTRPPGERAKDLGSTGVPEDFKVYGFVKCSDPRQVERTVHYHFRESRTNPRREFFRVTPEVAMEELQRHGTAVQAPSTTGVLFVSIGCVAIVIGGIACAIAVSATLLEGQRSRVTDQEPVLKQSKPMPTRAPTLPMYATDNLLFDETKWLDEHPEPQLEPASEQHWRSKLGVPKMIARAVDYDYESVTFVSEDGRRFKEKIYDLDAKQIHEMYSDLDRCKQNHKVAIEEWSTKLENARSQFEREIAEYKATSAQ